MTILPQCPLSPWFYKNTFHGWLSQNRVYTEKIRELIEQRNNQAMLILINIFLKEANGEQNVSNLEGHQYEEKKG